jgi:hypothetical protein
VSAVNYGIVFEKGIVKLTSPHPPAPSQQCERRGEEKSQQYRWLRFSRSHHYVSVKYHTIIIQKINIWLRTSVASKQWFSIAHRRTCQGSP